MTVSALANIDSPAEQPPVPLVDLGLQHLRIAEEVRPAIEQVMNETSFVLGPEVSHFENEFADYCAVTRCVGVGNGTDAIELALRGAGIGKGAEVIIPANTFVATAEGVVRAGARPVLADCTDDYLLDPEQVAATLTRRTRAVIGVDLYGQVPDFAELAGAAGPDVLLFEDAAQSQGATRWGQPSGSFGVAASTSFYPGKNLGAYGDAGAVLTGHDDLADRVRALRSHGGQRRYEHTYLGTNSRLDSIQAAVLRVKLRHLPRWNEERRTAATRYFSLLRDLERVVLPAVVSGNQHVWHLFVVRVPQRDQVLADLQQAGIGAAIHYPAPIHLLPAFTGRFTRRAMPRSEAFASQILTLPLFPGITAEQQERVANALRTSVSKLSGSDA